MKKEYLWIIGGVIVLWYLYTQNQANSGSNASGS
jgi:hypothetical protein